MVLQRGMDFPIWGYADPEQGITISFEDQRKSTIADKDGRWMVKLDPLQTSDTPQQLTLLSSDSAEIKIIDVLVGDVWFCSGQSNMALTMEYVKADFPNDLVNANLPTIRQGQVAHHPSLTLTDSTPVTWQSCSPQTVNQFTATGFYFARELTNRIHVPIGLINSSWDNTSIESWTSLEALKTVPDLTSTSNEIDLTHATILAAAGTANPFFSAVIELAIKRPHRIEPAYLRGALFEGMVHPIMPFAIKGVVWYQGEHDANRGLAYRKFLPLMIHDWREKWGQGEFPFLVQQLPNYNDTSAEGTHWAELREAQWLTTRSVPNTYLSVAIDIGETNNVHPHNKAEIGRRLSLLALSKSYGEPVECCGPTYKSMTQPSHGVIRILFDSTSPIKSIDGAPLKQFTIAGADGNFVPANAKIDGNSVLVSSPDVHMPVAVRYAFKNNPQGCNLTNDSGLPAIPFRTDAP